MNTNLKDYNRDMWQQIKDILDWFWVMFVGIFGNLCAHWDSYVAKVIALLTLSILIHKFKGTFFPSKKQKKPPTDYDV